MADIPVIALDGPSGSGKSTVSARVAKALSWTYLDTGSLYRWLATQVMQGVIDSQSSEAELSRLFSQQHFSFIHSDQTDSGWELAESGHCCQGLRSSEASAWASKLAARSEVRHALLPVQRYFRQAPGVVAEGRDIASVVFPNPSLAIYLTASVEVRAERRLQQLRQAGEHVSLDELTQQMIARDERDSQRSLAPLKVTEGAKVLDTTTLTQEDVIAQIVNWAMALGVSSGR